MGPEERSDEEAAQVAQVLAVKRSIEMQLAQVDAAVLSQLSQRWSNSTLMISAKENKSVNTNNNTNYTNNNTHNNTHNNSPTPTSPSKVDSPERTRSFETSRAQLIKMHMDETVGSEPLQSAGYKISIHTAQPKCLSRLYTAN